MARRRKASKSRKSGKGNALPRVTRDEAQRIQNLAVASGLSTAPRIDLDALNAVEDPKVRKILMRLANDKLRSELKIAVGLSQLGFTQKQLAVAVRGLLEGRDKTEIEKDMAEVGPRKKTGYSAKYV